MDTIYASPICELKELKDIFIELTAKNCNTHCRECYIDFPFSKTIKDYIKPDTVKNALNTLNPENIRTIYLTGAEPMTHPDFNSILRLCLKIANVCICTNASFINEKKSRFLKNVEAESNNQVIFKLSFAHFDELKNDTIRYRGSFRQNIYALKCLNKYEFLKVITVSNYYNEPHNLIIESFQKKISDLGLDNIVIQINNWSNPNSKDTDSLIITNNTHFHPDCQTSRTLTETGVYACPLLANDYRGRVGSDFSNYSKNIRLETSYCSTCLKNKDSMFVLDIDI